MIKLLHICLLVFATVSCTSLNYYSDKDNPVVAEVGDKKLHLKDLAPLFSGESPGLDSVYVAQEFIDSWVKNELKKREAEKLFSDYQDDIEVLVEKYRNSLLMYKYENYYGSMVDTTIAEKEILEYYLTNKNQFMLASPIVKAKLLVLPVNYKKETSVSRLFYSSGYNDYQDMLSFVEKDNLALYEFNDEWIYFTDLVKYLPFNNQSLDDYLKTHTRDKITDNEKIYLIQILDYKSSNTAMPLNFVRKSIEKSIINNKRRSFYRSIEDSVYNRALRDASASVIKVDAELLKKLEEIARKNKEKTTVN